MPLHTIQGIIKKSSGQPAGKLTRHVIEARVLNKIFMICVLYSYKYTGDRMNIATLFRKNAAVAVDIKHMFTEKGFLEVTAGQPLEASKNEEELEELCTEHAIECGAEEIEILDFNKKQVLVSAVGICAY